MKRLLATIALLAGIFTGSTFIAYATTATFRVVQTPVYHLYTGESGSATTIRITPYPVDLDGVKLTMTDFGSTPTVTVDPGFKSIEEIESFTGITDNGDGTATLTGLARDLTSKYPYTTAGTGRTHGSGAVVVFGNNPQVYGRLAAPENDNYWLGVQTLSSTTPPRFDVDPGAAFYTTAPATVVVSLGQLNRTSIAGAANSSESQNGIAQLAFPGQAASSTSQGSTGARLVLPASIATSGCAVATSSVIVSENGGKISQNCLDLTKLFTLSGGILVTASSTLTASTTLMATTSIKAASVTGSPFILNGVAYAFPSACTGSSTILSTDGNGNITCEQPFIKTLAINTNINVAVTNASATTTGYLYTVPAGTLTTANIIHAKVTLVASGPNLCWPSIDIGNGTATTTLGLMSVSPSGNTPVQMGVDLMATSSTDVYGAFSAFNNMVPSTNSTFGGYGGTIGASGGFAHITIASQWYIDFRARVNSGGSGSCNFDGVDINVERQQ